MNRVNLEGKVSRVSDVRYTPSGVPVMQILLAVPQELFQKRSNGYFEVQLEGNRAINCRGKLRIGQLIRVTGSLWTRTYTNRQGDKVTETKVLGEKVVPKVLEKKLETENENRGKHKGKAELST